MTSPHTHTLEDGTQLEQLDANGFLFEIVVGVKVCVCIG